MSRVGKNPIAIPKGTKVAIENDTFLAEGPKGKVSQNLIEGFPVEIEDGWITVKRMGDSGPERSKHGLLRALLANAVAGVSEGFVKKLNIVGVGYRAEVQGKEIKFALGYSHPVIFAIPEGIAVEIDKKNQITVSGCSRQQVGQVAAEIRSLRRPDAYKGKGIRYSDEVIRLKAGKAGAAG